MVSTKMKDCRSPLRISISAKEALYIPAVRVVAEFTGITEGVFRSLGVSDGGSLSVEKIEEFSVLFLFLELTEVLSETVEGEFGVVVNVDFHWVGHEFLANWSDLF